MHFCLLCKGKLPLRGAPGRSQACGPFVYRFLCCGTVVYCFFTVVVACFNRVFFVVRRRFLSFFAADLKKKPKKLLEHFLQLSMKDTMPRSVPTT